ncbi:type II toxin-antitoxin system VapC family toxin [Microlunatus aurantiacus]|uniref:Ribonuclease VapC n=1 Tax=Microlunatus aurantiacus TaxID=446786 RepID=A0ABP7DUY6_9ACTN
MILVDTAVWIDHLHSREPRLVSLLLDAEVCVHPMVVGELALGSLRDRSGVLALMRHLPEVPTAAHHEVLDFVETHDLHGTGLSLVDAHLLAALRLSRTDRLWTRDRRLRQAAERLDVVADDVV